MKNRYASTYSRSDGPLYRHRRPKRYRRTVTLPSGVSAPIRLLFSEMARLRVTYDELEESSGTRRASIKAWRHKNAPTLATLEPCLNSVGWFFIPTPMLEIQPPEIASGMAALAAKMNISMPEAFAALLDWTARQQNQAIAADQQLAEITRRREAALNAANDNTRRPRASARGLRATEPVSSF